MSGFASIGRRAMAAADRELSRPWKIDHTRAEREKEKAMGELLGDKMTKLADVLHWIGKYEEANACALLGRWLRARKVLTVDQFEAFVEAAESVR